MALINCSECGYEFSDQADACSKCGCPNAPGGMTPIGPPPEPDKKSGRGRLSKTQKIVLTVVLSTVFVPVIFIAPIFCKGVIINLFRQLMSGIPAALLEPLAMAVGLVGFAIPCGLFAWIISRIWLRG